MRVDRDRSRLDQILDSVPQSEATAHRVPGGSMKVAEKVRLMPMQKWIWQRVRLEKPQKCRNLGEDGG